MPPFRRRWLSSRRLLALALLPVFLWLGSSAAAAWRLTSRGQSPFPEPAPQIDGVALEEPRIRTRDGEELGAWLARGDASHVCVLLLHGNNDSRTSQTRLVEALARRGHGVLALSHRAHGDSTGNRNDFGWSAREDVIAAVGFLERELPARRIVILGPSLGSASAIFAAKELGSRVAGYILESPYTDLKTAVRNRTENYLPPVLDWIAYAGLLAFSGPFLPVPAEEIRPIDHVAEIPVTVPVLFLAGTADRHARPADVLAMQQRIASHSTLVNVEGGEHGKLRQANPETYDRAVADFLEAKR